MCSCLLAIFIVVLIIIIIHACCTDIPFLIFVLSALTAVTIILYLRHKVRKILNVQGYVFKDAKLHQNRIDIFLMELAHEKGSYIHVVEEEVGIPYSLKKKEDVLTLIRMANRLGCEVIIRKVSDHDTEREDYTPEVFEAILKRMEEKSQKFYRK